MSFIKNYQIAIISIIIITIILVILISTFFIRKWRNKSKSNKKSISELIKKAKPLVKRNKIKNKLSQIHIFYGDYPAAKDYIIKLKPECAVIDNGDFPLIAIDKSNASLLFKNNDTENLKKLKKKLNLHFYKLNYCFDISNPYFYEAKSVNESYKKLTKLRLKTIVVSFYNSSLVEQINSFNNSIGKKNIFRLTKDDDINQKVDETILSRILNSKDNIYNKHFSVKTLNQIRKCLKNIYPDLKSIDKEIFFNFSINKPDNITAKAETIFFSSSPEGIIINSISLLFSLIFVVNIFQQIDLKQQISIKSLKNLPNEKPQEITKILENKVDSILLLDSIYPREIKYHYIYEQYANTLLKEVIQTKYNDTKNLSIITAFLIFFEYLSNNHTGSDVDDMLKIISSLTDLSEQQLKIVLRYASNDTKTEIIKQVIKRANNLYNNHLIEVGEESEGYISTRGFNTEYLGISDTHRAKIINDIYIRYLYKCTIDNAIPNLVNNYTIPVQVNNIFLMYEDQFDTSSKKLCNSSYIDSITKNVSLIFNQEESDKKFNSFSDMLNHIDYIIKSLEENSKEVSDENSKQSHAITLSLINYTLNSVINATYNKKELPLTNPVNERLYMVFTPSFYSEKITISPIYSKEYIKDNIDPINEKFNKLITNLKTNYDIEPDFLIAIYNSSINNYNAKYINAYNQMINVMNNVDNYQFSKNISSKDSLNLFLLAMSSNDASFNNLIEFYSSNTDLIKNDKTKDKSKKITKVQQFYKKITSLNKKDEKENHDISQWISIDNYFKENNDYLESKKYANYKSIFKRLNNLIREKGYIKTYNEIKQGFKPLNEVYSDLSQINSPQNNSLYILLKKHLDFAIEAIKTIAIQDAITNLDNTVNLEYEQINSQFPFNKNSNKVVSDELITKDLDNNGYIYSGFIKYLKPLLTYDKTKNRWDSNDLTTKEQKDYVNKFNKIYNLNKLLWDNKRNPKTIEFKVTPIQNKDNNYTFFSLILDKQNFVNSLNIDYLDSTKLLYSWISKPSTTITIEFNDGSTDQISYQGEWSILKAIKDAKCNQENICTWTVQHKGKEYPVSFKIESNFVDTLGWTE
ncbi:hypothetical protein [Francisella sp. LA112445]|uniref:hypothetical protein n=1 Tax=Francisella sp. LA112445 TaxID=1395624 RepID=UPI001788ACF9|nr:hypothetical protein [Francisella sp. LA112445]QIW10519.1 hypothetical protein FIP56_07340 [Francisella sp. LA112445]